MKHPENFQYEYDGHFVEYIDFMEMAQNKNLANALRVMKRSIYSKETARKLQVFLRGIKPDIVHLNSIHAHLTPSILDVLDNFHIPVVWTLHDYKLVCASYLLYNNRKPCQVCHGKRFYNCLLKRCVKGSITKSMFNTIEMYVHHIVPHLYDYIDIFISPSMFLKEMLRSNFSKLKFCDAAN